MFLKLATLWGMFKIGLQMLANSGPSVFADILQRHSRARFFYDAKFHDIPLIVEAAARNSGRLPGIEFISIHASAGKAAMRQAVNACPHVKFLAITALTSLSDEDCLAVYGSDRRSVVLRFADWAAECNLAGIVCSPLELQHLKDHPLTRVDGRRLLRVVPGIRPQWARSNDQNSHRHALRGGTRRSRLSGHRPAHHFASSRHWKPPSCRNGHCPGHRTRLNHALALCCGLVARGYPQPFGPFVLLERIGEGSTGLVDLAPSS